jgi:hypothetical protein
MLAIRGNKVETFFFEIGNRALRKLDFKLKKFKK